MSIAAAISYRGQDTAVQVAAGLRRMQYTAASDMRIVRSGRGVALGVTNEGSIYEEAGGCGLCVAWDGPLYERAELASRLDTPLSEATNASLAALAYRRWGDTFPDELDGEYAFVLWDTRRRCTLLGRDAMGQGCLHYSRVGEDLFVSSEPRGLIGWPGVDSSLDETSVARMLSMQVKKGQTLYRGIRAVPAASVLLVEQAAEPRQVRYWFPLRNARLHLRSAAEYSELLHAAMVRAVSVRLPSEGSVAAQLSSGFDSSSVTALAAQALAKQNRQLIAYTSAPVQVTDARQIIPNRFADEWPLAAEVAAMYPNIEHIRIPTDSAAWWDAIDTLGQAVASPQGFIRNSRWYYAMHRHAQQRGVRTMLESKAGNLTGSYDGSFGLYDLRRRGQWLDLARAIASRRAQGETWKQLVMATWMPSAATTMRLRRLRRDPRPQGFFESSLMRPEFYNSTGLPALHRTRIGTVMEGDRTDGRTWRLSLISRGDTGMANAGILRAFGMRREDATADRRLAELVLSFPDEAFAPGGVPRDLYRLAFRQDLPQDLLSERRRGLQGSDFLEQFGKALPLFREEVERLVQTPDVVRMLDVERMRGVLDCWRDFDVGSKSSADSLYNYTFGGALCMGRFIRQMQEEGERDELGEKAGFCA